jgi:hypothetical protein
MVMWLWMYAVRIPAMQKAKLDPNALVDDPEMSLDRALPPRAQWPAHNYNHLHEAPTVFYATCLVLAVAGQGNGHSLAVAWVYVGLRVIHSLWQATSNRVMVRFGLFALSSVALLALVVHTAMVVFGLT